MQGCGRWTVYVFPSQVRNTGVKLVMHLHHSDMNTRVHAHACLWAHMCRHGHVHSTFICTCTHVHTHAEPRLQAKLAPSLTCLQDTTDGHHKFRRSSQTRRGFGLSHTQAAWGQVVEGSHRCTCFLLPADADLIKKPSEPNNMLLLLPGDLCHLLWQGFG